MQESASSANSVSLRALPGVLLHCALLTVLTVALTAFTGWQRYEALLRPLFFALLYSCVHATGRRHPHIRGLPLRLVEAGFLVLTAGSLASAVLLLTGAVRESWLLQLRLALDSGPIFLLGFVLLAYGLLLWIPLVLEGHRQLEASVARTRGELQWSESARARMEQRLVDTQRLSILGELAAGIAHDLRNPLTIMKGAAEALLRRARSAAATQEHAEVICRGVDKADRTIQALIDLGRPRAKRPGEVLLDEVAREVLQLMQIEARRRRIELTAKVGHLVARGDREPLVQVLLNLLLNAVQASADSSAVTLRARALAGGTRHRVAIAVEDRGQGLPPEVRRHVFTPFFTTRTGGTGLGLLSSRRIVHDMGGSLGLFPRLRGGARALVVLEGVGADRPPTSTLARPHTNPATVVSP